MEVTTHDVDVLYVEPEAQHHVTLPPVAVRDVYRIFTSGDTETVALRGVSVDVGEREFVAVAGPSGCGKSTLLAMVAMLDVPTAGEVWLLGQPTARLGVDERAQRRAGVVSIVLQAGNLWSQLSASENVQLAATMAGLDHVADRAEEALTAVGLERRARERASRLSGGEQQRVAIAMALARESKVVLADEPTGELDRANEAIVLDQLAMLRERTGCSVVIATHSREVAARADRMIELLDGTVVSGRAAA